MRILLHGPDDLTLGEFTTPGLHVEHEEGVHVHMGPLQMFVASMGMCTASVMQAYAEQLRVGTDGLQVHLRWKVAGGPRRLDDIEMDILWPELPESRLKAAERAVGQCTLHNTLQHPPHMRTMVTREAARA